MKLTIKQGTTSKLIRVFIPDSSKTDGSGRTGLVFNSAGLVARYIKEGATSSTAITLVTMTVGTWVSGGFKEISAANMPGWYELGLPNAALSTTNQVGINLRGASTMAPVPMEIQLVVDLTGYQDGYVFVSDSASNTNTVLGIDGTVDNPVSTLAAGKTLADQMGKKLKILGSYNSITVDLTDYTLQGLSGYSRISGTSVNLSRALVHDMILVGVCNFTSNSKVFNSGVFSITGTFDGYMDNCQVNSIVPVPTDCNLSLSRCSGDITLDCTAIVSNEGHYIGLVNHAGIVTITDVTADDLDIQVNSDGGTVIEGDSSNTDGTLRLIGIGRFDNNASSFGTVTRTDWKDIYNMQLESYVDGIVYFNSGATANPGTKLGIDGTSDNPVTSEAAAKTLADIVGHKICIKGTFPLTDDYSAGYEFRGCDGSGIMVGTGTANIENCLLTSIDISGQFVAGDNSTKYFFCTIHDVTGSTTSHGLSGFVYTSAIYSTIRIKGLSTAELHLESCYEAELTTSNKPVIDWVDATLQGDCIVRDFKGQLTFDNVLNAGVDIQVHSNPAGMYTINASVNQASADFVFVGLGTLVDNKTAATVNLDNWFEVADLGGLSNQEVRNALNGLAPTNGAAVAGSIDEQLQTIDTNVDAILVDTGNSIPTYLVGMDLKLNTIDTNVDTALVNQTNIEAKVDVIDTNVDAILVDTGTSIPGTLTTMDGKLDTIDTNVDDIETLLNVVDGKVDIIDGNVDDVETLLNAVDAKIDIIDTNVDDIEAVTTQMVFTEANLLDVNVQAVVDSTTSASKAQKAMQASYSGTVGAGAHTTLTLLATSLTGFATDAFKNKSLNIINNTAEGAGAAIDTYDTITGAFTFKAAFPLSAVPVSGDEIVVV